MAFGYFTPGERDPGSLTQAQLKRRRAMNERLLTGAADTSPVQGGWAEALARVASGAIGGYFEGQDNKAQKAQEDAFKATFDGALENYLKGSRAGGAGPMFGGMSSSASGGGAPSQGAATASTASDVSAEPTSFTGNQQEFVDLLMPSAVEASARTGVDPRIIVAQGALESAWGKSAPGNNYFGIKSHGKEGGQTFTTHEVIDGRRVKINDSFRQFASPADSVDGYADFLLDNPRYRPMMEAQGLDAQIAALGRSGYATDPAYAQKIASIARGLPMPGAQAGTQVASADPSFLPSSRDSVETAMQMVDGAQPATAPVIGAGGPVPATAIPAPAAGTQQPGAIQVPPAPTAAMAYAPQGQPQPAGGSNAVAAIGAMLTPPPIGSAPAAPPLQVEQAGGQDAKTMLAQTLSGAPQGFDGFAYNDPSVTDAPAAPPAPSMSPAARSIMDTLSPAPAQSGGADLARLMQLYGSEWASPEQKAMVGMMIENEMKRNAPPSFSDQLAMERLRYDRTRDQVEDSRWNKEFSLKEREAAGFRTLSPEQAQAAGLPAGGVYQVGPNGQVERVQGTAPPDAPTSVREFEYARQSGFTGTYQEWEAAQRRNSASSVNVNSGSSSKFIEESDKSAASRIDTIIQEGNAAPAFMGDIQQLADLGKAIGTGKGTQIMAALGPYADLVGVKLDGLGEAQAYQSIVARLAPQMRPAGSGATSDFDARQFLQALPSLGNLPGGNEIITGTFEAIAQNKMQAAEIASLTRIPPEQGGLTWVEAERQIRALPNPYERYRAFRSGGDRGGGAQDKPGAAGFAPGQQFNPNGVPAGDPTPAAAPRARNPVTGQIIELRSGQWVPVQ